MDAKSWIRVGSDPSRHLLWFLAPGHLRQIVFAVWQSALSCWGDVAIRECCCHQGVYLVCNGVWVGGQVASTWMLVPIIQLSCLWFHCSVLLYCMWSCYYKPTPIISFLFTWQGTVWIHDIVSIYVVSELANVANKYEKHVVTGEYDTAGGHCLFTSQVASFVWALKIVTHKNSYSITVF